MENGQKHFTDKAKAPAHSDLMQAIGHNYILWEQVCKLVITKYPAAISVWNFPGEKYGWSYRIKDKKRAIIYPLPRDQFFMVAFVFGAKAYENIMNSNIAETIKKDLQLSRVYAEGRGVRIVVKDKKIMKDISRLIDIKIGS